MEAITFLRNKGILGEIHTKWMITFSDGSQVDLVKLFDEFVTVRQPAMKEIENLMERWHLSRADDTETLTGINDVLVKIGLLGFFNRS